MAIYTFRFARSDGGSTMVEAMELADDCAAYDMAGRLLDHQPGYKHVEVWAGERGVLALHRALPFIRPIADFADKP